MIRGVETTDDGSDPEAPGVEIMQCQATPLGQLAASKTHGIHRLADRIHGSGAREGCCRRLQKTSMPPHSAILYIVGFLSTAQVCEGPSSGGGKMDLK